MAASTAAWIVGYSGLGTNNWSAAAVAATERHQSASKIGRMVGSFSAQHTRLEVVREAQKDRRAWILPDPRPGVGEFVSEAGCLGPGHSARRARPVA